MERYSTASVKGASTNYQVVKDRGLMDEVSYLHDAISELEEAILRMTAKLSPVLRMSGPPYETDCIEDEVMSEAEYSVKLAARKINDIKHGINLIEIRASI